MPYFGKEPKQNRRQKGFNGALRLYGELCVFVGGGLDFVKINKNSTDL